MSRQAGKSLIFPAGEKAKRYVGTFLKLLHPLNASFLRGDNMRLVCLVL